MGAREIQVRWARDPDDVGGAFAVRERVFCEEQGVPREQEIDERDADALHLVALDPEGGRVIGTLRLLVEAEQAKVGRVAVEREWRRRGVAALMLELALSRARELGCVRVRLAAQLAATSVYRRAGFAVESEPFEEAGIQHVLMGRTL
jgi:putative N-acetyltransferase (TIGR04045 family)